MSDTDWENRISSGSGTPIAPPVIPGRNNAATVPPTWPITATNWGRTGEIPPPPPGFVWETGEHVPVQKRDKGPALAVVIVALVFLACGTLGVLTILGTRSKPSGQIVTPTPAAGEVIGTTASQAGTNTAPTGKTVVTPTAKPDGSIPFTANKAFRVGDFEISIKSRKCGITSVGTQYLDTKAQGAFCRIDMTAKNVTRSPHFYDTSSAVTALDATGRKFNADGEAGIYGNSDAAGFLDQINPGNTVRAFVFFDIPKGTTMNRLVFSPGLFTTADDVTVKF